MNLPNKLTVSRFVLTGLFLVAMFSRSPVNDTIALVLFSIAGLTDYFDGKIARERNLITSFGILMDPLADKVLIAAAFICLIPEKAIPAWSAIVIISREFLITGLRLLAASQAYSNDLGLRWCCGCQTGARPRQRQRPPVCRRHGERGAQQRRYSSAPVPRGR